MGGRREGDLSARRATNRLRALAADPRRQAEFAAELLASSPAAEVVIAALSVLDAHPRVEAAPELRRLYASYDSGAKRRDPGGFTRTALVQALRHVAVPGDMPLFERALATFEPTPQDPAAPAQLRAAALAALVQLDPEAGGMRAAALLADTLHLAWGSGEPALTAARTLGALEAYPALLYIALTPNVLLPAEVVAEAIRGLAGAPGATLLLVAERFIESRDDVLLLGLCDLFTGHRRDDALLRPLRRFLDGTDRIEVYGYLAAAIVASRRGELIAVLNEHAAAVPERAKLLALTEALRHAPPPNHALRLVRERLSEGERGR